MSDFAKGISDLAGVIDRILGIDKIEQQTEEILKLMPSSSKGAGSAKCESCGAPASHVRAGYDVAPTDRGDERPYKEEWFCDECDPERP